MPETNQDTSIFELASNFCVIQDVDMLLKQITVAVEQMTASEAASILLLDDAKKQLVFRVATGEKGSTMKKFFVPVGRGIAGWVAEHGEAVLINDVKSDTRFTGQIDKSSGFTTRSILAVPMKVDNELIGVCEALNKIGGPYTEEDQKILNQLASLAAATLNNARLSEDHRNFFSHIIDILTIAIEGMDTRMTGHSYRVAQLACRIGRAMGIEGEAYRNLYYGAILHDLGRVAIYDLRLLPSVLTKTIERTPEKLHPLVGAELVKNIRLLSPIAPMIRHHHEYFDGSGHPDGLVGADIPLEARIIALAEQVDELRMQGLVGNDFDTEAVRLAKEGSGTKFDPDVVNIFLSFYT
ncbi:MAG: GAF domain-containing protein [Elusimicrobia bacterium]|nr:GAF domain-containing protein [Candidatus Obscuribacterium magneticum]